MLKRVENAVINADKEEWKSVKARRQAKQAMILKIEELTRRIEELEKIVGV
jgi:hypothetical protein